MKTRRKKTVSMRAVLVLMLFVIGFLPMVIQGRILLTSLRQSQIDARTLEIQNQALILSNRLTQAGYLGGEVTDTILDSQMDVLADVFNGRVVIVDETYRIIRDTFKLAEGKYHISEEVIRCFRGETSSKYNSDKHYLIETFPIYAPGSTGEIDGVMVVTASTASILNLTDMVGEKVTMFEVMALIVVIIAILVGARLYLKPVAAFSQGLKKIASGDAEEIHVNDYRETREMSDAVSQAFAKLREVDNSRQEFVSNVSHELKTPIALIQGYAEGLTEGMCEDEESRNYYCGVIMDEAVKMNRMVKQLLNLTALEFGNDTPVMETFNLTDVIRGIITSSSILIQQKEAQVIFEHQDPLPVVADEFKIEEVITNYLTNALNHANGEKKIEIRAEELETQVKVTVFNTGDPIPEEDISKLWTKFYKVDKARTRAYGGSGIGLSIVKAIMESHHQEYGARNVEGGVEFWFTLEKGKEEQE